MNKFLSFLGSILLACFVVPAFYFVSNYPQFSLQDTFLIVALFGAIALGLAGLLWLVFRDSNEVSFLMYGGSVVFWFSYDLGLFYLKRFGMPGFLSNYSWGGLFAFCFFAFFCFVLIAKYFSKIIVAVNRGLCVFVLILSGLLLLNIGQKTLSASQDKNTLLQNQSLRGNKQYPNVYHILLDAHPNQKAMEVIGGDLKSFYKELEVFGFVTFPESKSNYPTTYTSVPSMLSMSYLEKKEEGKDDVFEHFKGHGYNLQVVVQNHLVEALYPNCKIGGQSGFFQFLYTLFSKTFFKHYYEDLASDLFKKAVIGDIESLMHKMSSLKRLYGTTNNLFYTHIVCPHEPCIFTKKAKSLGFSGWLKKTDKAYQLNPEAHKLLCENVYGIDSLALKNIKEVIKQYETETIKPIIVLHSDHSILNDSRNAKSPYITSDTVYGNLLALYVPDEWKQDAKELKFINLYRWIFNHLFGDKYEYFEKNEQK